MKRLALAALTAAAFAAPIAAAPTAAADSPRYAHRHDRDYDDWDDRRDERRAYRQGYRHGRWDDHWDRRRYNGYFHDGRWVYGPAPWELRDRVHYGYRAWRVGARLPAYYHEYYEPVDWRYYRLRPPPRGCHYIRDDRGDYLLVGIATGVILGVVLAD